MMSDRNKNCHLKQSSFQWEQNSSSKIKEVIRNPERFFISGTLDNPNFGHQFFPVYSWLKEIVETYFSITAQFSSDGLCARNNSSQERRTFSSSSCDSIAFFLAYSSSGCLSCQISLLCLYYKSLFSRTANLCHSHNDTFSSKNT